jgi:2-methylcitrate dehydratase PrpD
MTIVGDLALFVREASVKSLPDDQRAMVRRHVADIAMAGIAGTRTHEAAALRSLSPGARGDEEIAIAATIVRHTEVDDIHLPSCTTPSSVAVPTALMLAAQQGDLDAGRVADAVWVGTELVTRFGVAIDGPNALYRGVWPTCVGAPLGVAAVAARLWRLDQAQTENALSLALMLMAGRTGRFQGALSGRWVLFIGAIAEGLRAARAAREGFCGDATLLDGPWLEKAQGIPADATRLTRGLGASSIYPELSMKPFCTARQALGATDAFISLLDEGLDPRAVEAVTVRVPSTYAGMISQPIDPANRSSGFVSAGFQMGLAAFRRDHLWDLDRGAVMADADVLAFAGKVRVVADGELQKAFPNRWPAAIEVTAGGKTIERVAMAVTGDPDKRLDDARIADKGRRILTPQVGAEKTADIVSAAMCALDDAGSCRRIAGMFTSAMRA